ncbi:MAG: methylmalonyl Co-A mutase-associated GTPase MeaB [Pseudomonadota bacterium]
MSKQPELAPQRFDLDQLAAGVVKADRASLARAITLIESTKPEHRRLASELIQRLLPRTGKAIRLGISGVPGVGKSTTIDQLGMNLVEAGHRVAVLAVDPSSSRHGGSILGDKTRMARLSLDDRAYVRPSPSAGTLGGVAARTRETMLLCEAAGFDAVIVETVGTGQSETTVADMVDTFLVLMLPGAGDDLQGIKKGILEIADIIAINKADGEGKRLADRAKADYLAALKIMAPRDAGWFPPVMTMSGLHNEGLKDVWAEVSRHRELMQANSNFDRRRADQQVRWMWSMVEDGFRLRLSGSKDSKARLREMEDRVREGELAASLAAEQLLSAFSGE